MYNHDETIEPKEANPEVQPVAASPTHAREATSVAHDLKRRLLSTLRAGWKEGREISATGLLHEHPELSVQKSFVLDLAYEEYCQRVEAGQAPTRDEFCGRFSHVRHSLGRLLSVHNYLRDNPELAPDADWTEWPGLGETIAGFELIDVLGTGGFARVYLAEEIALGRRRVAVKCTREGGAEGEILGKLNHPNIVPVHSVGEDLDAGMTLICMPYLGSTTLADVLDRLSEGPAPRRARAILDAIDRARLSPSSDEYRRQPDPILRRGAYVEGAVVLAAQLAEALAYAHGKGICHLDLKPSNVLLDASGKPMLLDFNLSHDAQVALRRVGGTLPYMAPERLHALLLAGDGAADAADPRSDVYSLGVVLFECLTGFLPYGAMPDGGLRRDLAEGIWRRQQTGTLSFERSRIDVDGVLAKIIARCLTFDPSERIQTAEELARQLQQCLSFPSRARRFVRNHRRATGAACLASALAIGGVAYALAVRPPYGDRELAVARTELQNKHFTAAMRHVENAVAYGPSSSEAKKLRGEIACDLGWQAFEEGRYPEARDFCTQAMDDGLDTWKVRSCRGRTFFAMREYILAKEDAQKASKSNSSAGLISSFADCLCGLEEYENAIGHYRLALKKGFESAGLYNNLGYAQLQRGLYSEAIQSFDAALQLDNQSQFSCWNRAEAQRLLAGGSTQPIPERALADIRAAIRLGPPSARLFREAATIHYRNIAGERNEKEREQGVAYMLDAIRAGTEMKRIEAVPLYREMTAVLRERGQLDAALQEGKGFDDVKPEKFVDSLMGVEIE